MANRGVYLKNKNPATLQLINIFFMDSFFLLKFCIEILPWTKESSLIFLFILVDISKCILYKFPFLAMQAYRINQTVYSSIWKKMMHL